MTGMKDMMGKGQMMSKWNDQNAELDKLVSEMNSAPANMKLDAVAAVVANWSNSARRCTSRCRR